jgi:ApaG protein
MTTTLNKPRLGSDTVTAGVRVVVHPTYSSLESDPDNNYYKFVYRIRIRNESERTVQLMARHWVIVDADGERQDVRGEGVVGQQPVLEPGQTFEYASFCPLGTPWGTMEGSYQMRVLTLASAARPVAAPKSAGGAGGVGGAGEDGKFHVQIGRFFLVCPPDGVGDL